MLYAWEDSLCFRRRALERLATGPIDRRTPKSQGIRAQDRSMWLHSFSCVTAGTTEIEGKNHPLGKTFSPPGDVCGLGTSAEGNGSSSQFSHRTQHDVTFALM